MRITVLWLFGALATASCVTAPKMSPDAQVQSAINKCGLKGRLIAHVTADPIIEIHWLDPEADNSKVDCFFAGVKRLGLDFGFIGNAAKEP